MAEQHRVPKALHVVCVVDDTPVPGAWVTATLHMNDKTDFVSFHGPADDDGRVLVTGDDILQWTKRNRAFAPNDYLDPETDWAGTLTLTPLTQEAARAAIKFFKMFEDKLDYPETFARDLRTMITTVEPLKDQMMALRLAASDPAETADIVKLRRRPL
ncbi:MAG TPA: hypothetical protein VEG38_09155 [Acidimicrobiia bacterium]|nr:hypothetical protein [Acidimicrobiia bacterium]